MKLSGINTKIKQKKENEQFKINKDMVVDEIKQTKALANEMLAERIKKQMDDIKATIVRLQSEQQPQQQPQPQIDVAEAKNEYLNVIQQPEENPREVDEEKPEPKKLTKTQQKALKKKEARESKAKAKAEAVIPAPAPAPQEKKT